MNRVLPMSKKQMISYFMCITLCFLLTGCSGSQSTSSSGPLIKSNIDPCSLLAGKDADRIIGESGGGVPRELIEAKDGSQVLACDYVGTNIDTVSLALDIYPSATAAQQNIDREDNCGGIASQEDGLGEQACVKSWQPPDITVVLERNVILSLVADNAGHTVSYKQEIQLARIALKHF